MLMPNGWFFTPASSPLPISSSQKISRPECRKEKNWVHECCMPYAPGLKWAFTTFVLIGTDCYELSSEILNDAFTALERSDVVIGPAIDGGFYLIGLNRLIPELFLDRRWSTSEVFNETTSILLQLSIPYELLAVLPDIDTFDDLKKSRLWPVQL